MVGKLACSSSKFGAYNGCWSPCKPCKPKYGNVPACPIPIIYCCWLINGTPGGRFGGAFVTEEADELLGRVEIFVVLLLVTTVVAELDVDTVVVMADRELVLPVLLFDDVLVVETSNCVVVDCLVSNELSFTPIFEKESTNLLPGNGEVCKLVVGSTGVVPEL